jgi:hypothetical protein
MKKSRKPAGNQNIYIYLERKTNKCKDSLPHLGPWWGSNLVDAEGESGESQLCQSTRNTKKINFHRPLYVETKHTNFVDMIFFQSLLRFSYNLVPCPCLHHVFWREGHIKNPMKGIYIFSRVRMCDVSLSFSLQRLFFYSLFFGWSDTVYLQTMDCTAASLHFVYEKRTRRIGGMITDSRRPTSCDTNMC